MKKILLLVAIMLCCAMSIFAQNNKISYQAVVRDSENRLVANKAVTVEVSIYNGTETTAAYTETHSNVQTNYNGLFSLQIGNGNVTSGNWNAIDWKNAKVKTAVSLDGTQLADLEMPLTAVPYALYADYAEQINPDAVVVTNITNRMNTISDSVKTNFDNIAGNTSKLNALQNRVNVFNTHVCDTVMNCDGIKTMRDSIQTNAAAIADLQSADAAITNRMNTISDSVKTNFDNIAGNTSKLNALQNRVNVFNTHVCDTVMNCDGIKDMRDSLGNAFDTLKYYYDTSYVNQTLKQYLKTGALCDSIVKCDVIKDMRDSLGNAFDTLKYYFDSTQVKKAIHDSIGNGTLTIAITNGSTTIFKANDKNNKTVTLAKVAETGSYNDLSDIPTPPTVNDYAVTVNLNGTSAGSFTLNQSTNAVVNLDSVAVTKKGTTNTYKNTNDFTGGTITVPSNGTAIPRPANSDPNSCNNNNAVAVCDLLAMFDSLSNRIQVVFDSLKYLNDSLANELEALKNTILPTADAPTIKNLTSTSLTVKANNTSSVAAITSYEYCYSTNSDMSGATCQTSALDTLDLTGLTPNTDYYVTVKATNFAGSTTSASVLQRTPAHAPTATVSDPTAAKPAGFKVEVTGIDPKEKTDATTVQVCYVLKGSGDCPEKESADYAECKTVDATGIADTAISVTGLTPSTGYCAIVKVSNGDSTTIYGPWSVTTGADVTMTVSQTGGGTISLCGNTSVNVIYTATPSDGGSYTYSWSGSPASTSDNTATYSYTSASTYNVSVTATHTTEGHTLTATASTTVNSGGTAVSIGFCEYEGVVSVVEDPQGSPNSISWGDGQSSDGTVSTSTMHDYTTTLATGPYEVTITASNSDGCIFSRTMTVNVFGSGSTAADRTVKPCSVGSHAAQTGSTYTGNGHSGANHGLETVSSGKITSVTDYDGNAYPVVQIGNQCWLAENLRVSHSPKTGSNIVVNDAVNNSGSKMAVWYNNDQSTYEAKRYGLLYNWCAAMDTARPSVGSYTYVEVATAENTGNYFNFTSSGNHQGVCPTGWHVPTDAEWNAMEQVVNGSAVSGSTTWRGSHAGKLSTGCDWRSKSTANAPGNYANAARNSSGFSAVPAGYFYSSFSYTGDAAFFWSTTPRNISAKPTAAWSRYLYYNRAEVNPGSLNKGYGCSVRCVRD